MRIPTMTARGFKQRREALGLSQTDIAGIFGCSKSTIQRLERSSGAIDGVYVCAILYLKSKGVDRG